MTREEAIIIIGNLIIIPDDCYRIAEYQEAKAMAIKALEQEPILDKIRREIEDLAYEERVGYMVVDLDDVLRIIDKYKAESEDGE